jgi:hypothetical protein
MTLFKSNCLATSVELTPRMERQIKVNLGAKGRQYRDWPLAKVDGRTCGAPLANISL